MPRLDDKGQLVWTKRLTVIVVGVAALLGVGVVVVHLVAGAGPFDMMGLFATVAIIVAVGGRVTTLRNERWASVDEPPPSQVRARRGRVVISRKDVAARLMVAVVGVGWGADLWADTVAGPAGKTAITSAIFGSATVAFALLGFASRVVVTPDELIVFTTFTRHAIPRHLVGGLRETNHGAIVVEVEGGRDVRVPTGVHAMWIGSYWNYRPAEVKTAGQIRAGLAAIPATPFGGNEVVVRLRPATIAAAMLATGAFVTVCAVLASGSVPT